MSNQKEEWRDVKGYEGLYEVSNLGRVKSLKFSKEKIMKTPADTRGYLALNLFKDKKSIPKRVHKLVSIAFLSHTPDGYKTVVNHINFIRSDNRVENLEIVTARENCNLKHIKSTSKYVGVSWAKRNKKWKSQIMVNKVRKHLGHFDNEIEAHDAYQKELKKSLNS